MRLIALVLVLMAQTEPMHSETGIAVNPMIWADVPDPDVIRVGDDFYMVSTTMHLMPGCPVMHSKDLVNWETISYVFDKLTDTPSYNLEERTAYGKGQWATSLRYHNGRFYALFSPNAYPFKSYIFSAENPVGPWRIVTRTRHFHDSSLFFDDDGRVYVFSGSGNIWVTELNEDLSDVKPGGLDKKIIVPDEETAGLHEGTRVIKHNGKYYAFVINWPTDRPRRQLCYRADNITGPYERCVVLESQFEGFPYVGQGCLVDDADGNWWGVIFQDRGGVGRVLTLNPCRWVDGWPMLGDENGKVPASFEKKIASVSGDGIVASDEFSGTKSILWQWNHNPIESAWSLTERPGYLRLRTSKIVENLFYAPNTISQRMEGPFCEGTVKLDVSNMKEGDVAGFAAFNGDSGILEIVKDPEGGYKLTAKEAHSEFKDPENIVANVKYLDYETIHFDGPEIYLKIKADFNPGRDKATFAFSTDGQNWNAIGGEFQMIFDYLRFFMGTRFAIFNYATEVNGGYIDVDYFHYAKTASNRAE